MANVFYALESALTNVEGRFTLWGLLAWITGWFIALVVSMTSRHLAGRGYAGAAKFTLLPMYEYAIIIKKIFLILASVLPYWLFFATDGCGEYGTNSTKTVSPQDLGNCWSLNGLHTFLFTCLQFTYFPVAWVLWSCGAGQEDIYWGVGIALALSVTTAGSTVLACQDDELLHALNTAGGTSGNAGNYCQITFPCILVMALTVVGAAAAVRPLWVRLPPPRDRTAVLALAGLSFMVNLELMLSAYWALWLGAANAYLVPTPHASPPMPLPPLIASHSPCPYPMPCVPPHLPSPSPCSVPLSVPLPSCRRCTSS